MSYEKAKSKRFPFNSQKSILKVQGKKIISSSNNVS